jgi:hypothetical protein
MNSKNDNENISNINMNNNSISNSSINNSIDNSTVNNHSNNTNSNNNNNVNIQNVNIEIKYPLSFIDEDWKLEEIDERIQKMISINNFAYSSLLKEILKNNMNHNVYINKNTMIEQGMVFSNKDDKFIPMSLDNIISRSMEQLNKLLLYINEELYSNYRYKFENREYNIDIKNIVQSKNNIKIKYNDFIESKKIKDVVKLIFTEIFNNNNDISKKLYEEFMMIISGDNDCCDYDNDNNNVEIKEGY